MKKIKAGFIGVFLFLFLLQAFPAQADLTITPWRVVFQGRDRSAIIELINQTDRKKTYRLNWLVQEKDASGKYVLVPAKNQDDPRSFSKMVVFTPRQVTIEPHGHQTIRLSLRRPADLPPGEYREHLAMTRLAEQALLKDDPNAKELSMALNVNLGFSVPVIVRQGEDKDLKVSLTDLKLAMGGDVLKPVPQLKATINRDAGKFSTYGVLRVFWQPPQGKEEKIGALNNIPLYPEMQNREVSIPLRENPTSGKLRVIYEGKYESAGRTWAEKELPITK